MKNKTAAESRKRTAALGLFDGVHLGHRKVIGYAANYAAQGFEPAVFTFGNTTLSRKQGRKIEYIYTDEQKRKLISKLGIELIFSMDFGELKNLSGEEFVKEILIGRINAGCVVCGGDFRFGVNASCGISELCCFGEKYGFDVRIADDVRFEGTNVSSESIRTMLKSGDTAEANKLLGEAYRIDGIVVHGRQLGRTLNFPTANQNFAEGQLVPKFGVYVSETIIGSKPYPSITNIGVKPTVENGRTAPLAETYISGFSGGIYGENISVRLLEFVRAEKKFSSLAELKAQIAADLDCIRK